MRHLFPGPALATLTTALLGAIVTCRVTGVARSVNATELKEASEERTKILVRNERGRLISDLDAYMTKSPAAPDREEALDLMIDTAWEMDDYARVLTTAEAYEREFPEGEALEAIFQKGTVAALQSPDLLEKAALRIAAYSKRPTADSERAFAFCYALADSYAQRGNPATAIQVIDDLLATPAVQSDPKAVKALVESRARFASQGLPFHNFKTTDIDGRPLDTASLRGKVVLIDFWATWCAPCRESMPSLVRLARDNAGDHLVVIGVNLDENRDDLKTFLLKRGITWTQVPDERAGRESISDESHVSGIPDTILLDRKGRIYRQGLRGDALAAATVRLLAM
jgi:thiol-disulfide isomerase/thioredoxin